MKISICSDLHLEFGYQELPGGEVLILAGDIAEARSIHRNYHSTKVVQDTPNEFYRCSEFFKWECAKYDQVFYVMGNHEHYHNRFDKTYDILKDVMPANVRLLENECAEYNGVVFMGATLWTDNNRNDPLTIQHLKWSMNDYRVVKNHYEYKDVYGKLMPEATGGVHRRTVEYFKLCLSMNKDKPVVMITHHAPSFNSIHERYKHDTLMNGGYASNLSELILDNPQIKYWVHGHMHDATDYMIGGTRVVSNPRGYVGHESTVDNFKPDFTVEI